MFPVPHSKLDLLVLNDFLIGPLKDQERRDLVEILEDRYGHSSTVMTTQIPIKHWHEKLADPIIADAICDRVTHNAHVIALRGPSLRERKYAPSSNHLINLTLNHPISRCFTPALK